MEAVLIKKIEMNGPCVVARAIQATNLLQNQQLAVMAPVFVNQWYHSEVCQAQFDIRDFELEGFRVRC